MGYARHRPAFLGLISRASPILRETPAAVGWVQRGEAVKRTPAYNARNPSAAVKFLPKVEFIHGCLMGYARHRPAFLGLISRAAPILPMRRPLPVGWVQREGKAYKNPAAKRA